MAAKYGVTSCSTGQQYAKWKIHHHVNLLEVTQATGFAPLQINTERTTCNHDVPESAVQRLPPVVYTRCCNNNTRDGMIRYTISCWLDCYESLFANDCSRTRGCRSIGEVVVAVLQMVLHFSNDLPPGLTPQRYRFSILRIEDSVQCTAAVLWCSVALCVAFVWIPASYSVCKRFRVCRTHWVNYPVCIVGGAC